MRMLKKNDKIEDIKNPHQISVDVKYNIGNITHRWDYQQIRHYQIKNSKLEEKTIESTQNETKKK